MHESDRPTIEYRYTFLLEGGRERTFDLRLDRRSLALVAATPADPPPWTALSCRQCDNCPLNQAVHPHCPIALGIVDLVAFFTDVASYEEVDVRIVTDERSYVKHTTTAEAVSSLLGIYMVTSGCPVMDRLRPMVRFHLPMATAQETTFRAIAMYLVAQYFVYRRGGRPDWDLKGLPQIYREVQVVNRAFMHRLRQTGVSDASLNALVRLDLFASVILMSFDLDSLDEVEALFTPYLGTANRWDP